MTGHEKALEAAVAVMRERNPTQLVFPSDMQAAIAAYHAALEGQGDGEVAEIRKQHEEIERLNAGAPRGNDARHRERATLLTRLSAKAAEAERLRAALEEAANKMQAVVRSITDAFPDAHNTIAMLEQWSVELRRDLASLEDADGLVAVQRPLQAGSMDAW